MQPSPSRQLPTTASSQSASSALQNLLRLIATITADDINSAERCGGGGFGDVYLLKHAAIGKLALKRVRTSGTQQEVDSQLRRAMREADTWRGLDHPNILPFLDVLKRAGHMYLVSPFVQNGSLINFTRQYPNVDRARLIQEAAAGIAYFHRCQIIHGDIKAANILVSDDIRSLLCDFGMARPLEINTSVAMQGVGTIRWQSPELLSGGQKTFKSDVWAFGMTVYEILSGHMPYHLCEPNSAVIIALIVLKQRPPKDPESSPMGASYAPLWGVAQDCWHEDPDQRPDIQEVHKRLILGGFRSLLLSPPPRDDENIPNDAQVVLRPQTSPSPSPLDTAKRAQSYPHALARNPGSVGLVEHHELSEKTTMTALDSQEQTAKPQSSLVLHQPSNNQDSAEDGHKGTSGYKDAEAAKREQPIKLLGNSVVRGQPLSLSGRQIQKLQEEVEMCKNCRKRPRFETFNYCGKTCAANASSKKKCLICGKDSRDGFCSEAHAKI